MTSPSFAERVAFAAPAASFNAKVQAEKISIWVSWLYCRSGCVNLNQQLNPC